MQKCQNAVFNIFGMTRPEIKPQSFGHKVNALPSLPNKIVYEDEICDNPQSTSNKLNSHFVSEGNKFKYLPNTTATFTKYLHHDVKETFVVLEAHKVEIENLIDELEINKVTGYDEISCKILKILKHCTSHHLCNLYNEALTKGIFPDVLKIAKIVPLFKKGDRTNPLNYRPISLLSHVSNIFETLLYRRLINFLNKHTIISNCHFGFRKNYSTILAMNDLCENILQMKQKDKHISLMFLDLSKAFDSVNHGILIKKLEFYGFKGIIGKLLESYLYNRKQYIKCNGVKSDISNIKCGGPQGSVLGPLLFLLFINDLPLCSRLDSRLFADDAVLYSLAKNLNELELTMNVELQKVSEWLKANMLTLNYSKTAHILISSSKQNSQLLDTFNINIDGNNINRVNKINYLGVFIDDKLNWQPHIEYLCKKSSKISGMIYKVRKYMGNKLLLSQLYYALAHSHIHYGITVWGTATKKHLNSLYATQNRLLRAIFFSGPRVKLFSLYTKCEVLPIPMLSKHKVAKLV